MLDVRKEIVFFLLKLHQIIVETVLDPSPQLFMLWCQGLNHFLLTFDHVPSLSVVGFFDKPNSLFQVQLDFLGPLDRKLTNQFIEQIESIDKVLDIEGDVLDDQFDSFRLSAVENLLDTKKHGYDVIDVGSVSRIGF